MYVHGINAYVYVQQPDSQNNPTTVFLLLLFLLFLFLILFILDIVVILILLILLIHLLHIYHHLLSSNVTYAVRYRFWYGAKLIADEKDAGCTVNCLSGGTVIAVFFCVIIGASSLGQLAPPLGVFFSAKVIVFRTL